MRFEILQLIYISIFLQQIKDYERLVTVMLKAITKLEEEEKHDYDISMTQRRCIEVLNHLACQVDGHEKETVGRLGAIRVYHYC